MKKSSFFNKKKIQLGVDPGTAAHQLRADILFKFVKMAGYKCYRCYKKLTRETFSIDHKISWLDSDNPTKLFFDLNNITFSHQSCNSGAGRRPAKKYFTQDEKIKGNKQIQANYRKRKRERKVEK